MPSWGWLRRGQTPSLRWPDRHAVWTGLLVTTMEQSVMIVAIFVGAGLLAYVIVPGLIIIWDRVLDAIEDRQGED